MWNSRAGSLSVFLILLGAAVVLAGPSGSDGCSPTVQLPASGQTTPRPADVNDGVIDNLVAVPDDGTLQTGAPLQYTDNADGTITDTNTRLMWEKKSDQPGLHYQDSLYPWSGGAGDTVWDWLGDVNAEGGSGFAGYDDWRLPNVKELLTIIDYGDPSGPAVDDAFDHDCAGGTLLNGSCTAPYRYWTSTSNADLPVAAWYVNFNAGDVGTVDKSAFSYRVRAVRDLEE